jgi:hypothetical protein
MRGLLIGATFFLAACGSKPCLPSCADNEYCQSGSCRSMGVEAPSFFCKSHVPQAGDLACPMGNVCGKTESGRMICCSADSQYSCGVGCYRTAAEAQRVCPVQCTACVGAAGPPTPECSPGTCRCARVGACCPGDLPAYGCGRCFADRDEAETYCARFGTRLSNEGHLDTCSC